MGLNRSTTLIPHIHRKTGSIPELLGEFLTNIRPGTFSTIHILRQTNDNLCYAVIRNHFLDFRNGFLVSAAVDNRGGTYDAAQQIAHSNTGSGITVVDSHYSHFPLPPFFLNCPYYKPKKSKNKEKTY